MKIPIPEHRKKTISFRLNDREDRILRNLASKHKLPVSMLVRHLVFQSIPKNIQQNEQ